MFVPVVDSLQNPLMPTTPSRAKRWMKSGKATGFWKQGIFCVRLNEEPSATNKQEIVLGIDPGSKKEGFTLKSTCHTYLNINADAVKGNNIKEALELRKIMRRARRQRKTPYRACRSNRGILRKNRIPPSTKARWQWKLRVADWLRKIFPIEHYIVEDIKAMSKKGKKRWNTSFSPLEGGKTWFYNELRTRGKLTIRQGHETKELRDSLGLTKVKEKLSNVFEAHCVDSWVLANSVVGGNVVDNKKLLFVTPIIKVRRQLHYTQPANEGIRKRFGGTQSLGFVKGSIVKHPKYGVTYVGGYMKDRISLHCCKTGKRLCQNAKPSEIKFLCYSSWRTYK